ncbi:MAG: DUF3575 domain-containing protein [Muribaculaceae bacterium]
MKLNRALILLILTLSVYAGVSAQESTSVFPLHFRMGSAAIDSTYKDNSLQLKRVMQFAQKVNSAHNIVLSKVTFCGSASPEGNYKFNRRLANERIEALKHVVCAVTQVPDSIITIVDNYIEWDSLKCMVAEAPQYGKHKEAILNIINQDEQLVPYGSDELIDRRVQELKELDGGMVWNRLRNDFFAQMRNAYAIFVTVSMEPAPEPIPTLEVKADTVIETIVAQPEAPAEIITPAAEWVRHFYVKTNAVEWVLGISNIAAEVDLAPRFSVSLPISYSGWNYFARTTKFRKLSMYPELRYWLSDDNSGLFTGIHFGMAWYNFAIGGKYRVQDKGAHTPALGGGVTVGYRMPISRCRRWKAEFALGLGIYRLHYDKYINILNGALISTERHTYAGPDQVSVSIAYTFDIH